MGVEVMRRRAAKGGAGAVDGMKGMVGQILPMAGGIVGGMYGGPGGAAAGSAVGGAIGGSITDKDPAEEGAKAGMGSLMGSVQSGAFNKTTTSGNLMSDKSAGSLGISPDNPLNQKQTLQPANLGDSSPYSRRLEATSQDPAVAMSAGLEAIPQLEQQGLITRDQGNHYAGALIHGQMATENKWSPYARRRY
jgi:hypothetical protein